MTLLPRRDGADPPGSAGSAGRRDGPKQVALKILLPEQVADPEMVERFRHEVDQADGVLFLTMKRIEGKTLRALIKERARALSPAQKSSSFSSRSRSGWPPSSSKVSFTAPSRRAHSAHNYCLRHGS